MKFDKNSENNHIISQLLLIMASYMTDSDGISLFHFCINNLIDISNMSVSIEVRDMVQLLGILQQKYEKQIESSVLGKFYTERSSWKALMKMDQLYYFSVSVYYHSDKNIFLKKFLDFC